MTGTLSHVRRGRWVLGLTATAQFVLQLDVAIVNVALPTVQHELGFSSAGLQWVVTGYALPFGALLLLGGRLGDMIGHRRALIAGLVVFGLSSLSGGLAVGPGILVASRLAQGAGAALVAPAALALLTDHYTEPRERAHAMGIFQGAVACGALAGILAGGFLTEYAGWRWVLLINPPIIVLLLVFVLWRIPTLHGRRGVGLDLPGALTVTAAIAALMLGVNQGAEHGFGTWKVWMLVSLAAVLVGTLTIIERHASEPMLPPELLRRNRAVILGAALAIGAVLAGYIYFVSLYLQRVLDFSPAQTGLALAPATAMVMLMSTQVSRRVLGLIGTTGQLVIALGLMGIGQGWLAFVDTDGTYLADVLGPILITSAGIGLALPAASLAITSGAAPHQRGIAGALFVASQQTGSAIGLAALATVASAQTAVTGHLVSGYQRAFLVVAVVAIAAAVAVAIWARQRRE